MGVAIGSSSFHMRFKTPFHVVWKCFSSESLESLLYLYLATSPSFKFLEQCLKDIHINNHQKKKKKKKKKKEIRKRWF